MTRPVNNLLINAYTGIMPGFQYEVKMIWNWGPEMIFRAIGKIFVLSTASH